MVKIITDLTRLSSLNVEGKVYVFLPFTEERLEINLYREQLEKLVKNRKVKIFGPFFSNNLTVSIIGWGNVGKAYWEILKNYFVVNVFNRTKKENFIIGFDELDEKLGEVVFVNLPDEVVPEFIRKHKSVFTEERFFIFPSGMGLILAKDEIVSLDSNFLVLAPKIIVRLMSKRKFLMFGGIEKLALPLDKIFVLNFMEFLAKKLNAGKVIFKDKPAREEAVIDRVTESTILCGGALKIIQIVKEVLENKGYEVEDVETECIDEMIYILEVIKKIGFKKFFENISSMARNGALKFNKMLNEDYLREKILDFIGYVEQEVEK